MVHDRFLVFSDDWGEHPSSCQHIFKYIAKDNPVIWVNTIGMRNMRLTRSDLTKAIVKGRKMFGLGGQQGGAGEQAAKPRNLEVVQPPMLPFVTFPGVRRLNAESVIRTLRHFLSSKAMHHPILVTTVPNAGDYIGAFGEKKVVYYCVDDFTVWPGLLHGMVQEMEEELVRKADCIIATSERLCKRFKSTGKLVKLISHGVDIDHFSCSQVAEHTLLKSIPKPRIGCFGLFDERIDQHLLWKLAQARPDISIVITGNVVVKAEVLVELPNVYFTGAVPYQDLPAVVAGWELCLLPYKDNKQTSTISPLKIKEYIATGLPVLSTPIPGVMELQSNIYLGATSEEWILAVKHILANKNEEDGRDIKNVLKGESWENKASEFLELCSCSSVE